MSSWNQQNNMHVGQASFTPYQNWVAPSTSRMLPTYTANPIQGEHAAWQFLMGPNSEIYLPDSDEDVIWWIKTDNMGNRMVHRLDVVFPETPKPVDLNDLVERIEKLEERLNGKQTKPNTKRAEQPLAVVE